ncbi:MAG: hypothetical protein JXM70_01125 [Pirellulales bacterium]|nr:hypothetical protein [Pirellulales bacterium]
MTTAVGLLIVAFSGLLMGSGAWPFKLMRKYQFEHWWLLGMLVGLIILPWTITLSFCPRPIESIGNIPVSAILIGNVFSVGWGIANVLCGICFVRIGVALTGAILAGLGVSVGALVPMVFKGSGLFSGAPSLDSPAGLTVVLGVAIILVGVVLASLAGFGRDRILKKQDPTSGGFLGGLIMTVIAGILSSFMAFVFVYSQGPIVANLSHVQPGSCIDVTIDGKADKYAVGEDGMIELTGIGQIAVGQMSAQKAADTIEAAYASGPQPRDVAITVATGSVAANVAVYALALLGGAFVNLGYALWLMNKNNSWGVLFSSPKEAVLAVIIGVQFCVSVSLTGTGMLLLGTLGASVGWGIQQAMQMTGSQGLGFISGEWRGVHGRPRMQMYAAIAILVVASAIMAYGNTLAKS